MLPSSSSDSSRPSSFSIQISYLEEADGLSSEHPKVVWFDHPHPTLLAKDLIPVLYHDNANVKDLQNIRFLSTRDNVSSWALLKETTEWSLSYLDAPIHIILRLCKSPRYVRWITKVLKEISDNTNVVPYSEFLSPSVGITLKDLKMQRSKGPVSIHLLSLLGRQISTEYGNEVAVPLMNGLKALTLSSWKSAKPAGILFHGPPGTGKSRLCTMIMNVLTPSSAYVLFEGVASQLNERYVGEAEKRLKALTEVAKAEPDQLFCLFIDEIHGLAQRQSGSASSSSNQSSSNAKQDLLLSLLEVMTKYPNVIFLFATNFLAVLDPAFLRSKRVDLQILIPPLSFEKRSSYYSSHLSLLCQLAVESPSEIINELYPRLFALATTNFSKAQMDALRDRLQTECAFPKTNNPDLFWEGSMLTEEDPQPIGLDRALFHVTEVAMNGGEQSKKFVQTGLLQSTGIDDRFQQWMGETKQLTDALLTRSTGRKVIFAPSGLIGVEGPSMSSKMAFWRMPVQQSEQNISTFLHNFIIALNPVNSVYIVDGEFRNQHQDYFDEALDALYMECYLQTNSVIVVEMDDVIGLVNESCTITVGFSHTQGGTMTETKSHQIGFSDTWNFTSGISTSLGKTTSIGLTSTLGTSKSAGQSTTEGASFQQSTALSTSKNYSLAQNWGETSGYNSSKTFSLGEANSKGSSLSKTSGSSSSFGLSMSGPSLGFGSNDSTTTSNFNSYTRSWQESMGVGHSAGISSGSAQTQGSVIGQTHTGGLTQSSSVGNQITTGTSTSDAVARGTGTSKTETSQQSSAKGGSVSNLEGISLATALNVSESTSSSQAFTVRMQYPKAAHSITRLLNKINRAVDPNDPYIIVLYRVTEPPILSTLQHVDAKWE